MSDCKLKLGQVIKTQRIREGSVSRALIVENIQNCFFSKGALGFKSKSSGEEKEFVQKINRLMNLSEDDVKYKNAGLTGEKKDKTTLQTVINPLAPADIYSTGARKKYYYDIIIFTQVANPPDHYSFASHHYLRNDRFGYFTNDNDTKKKYYVTKKKKGGAAKKDISENPKEKKTKKQQGKKQIGKELDRKKSKKDKKSKKKNKRINKIKLLPDYALTDGSDKRKEGDKTIYGIEFHPLLDLSTLYRPNSSLNQNVFINPPRYYNRGYIISKGKVKEEAYSAFTNSKKSKTGLIEFLRCNGINSVSICGMEREKAIYNTIKDCYKYCDFISELIIIYDATKFIGIDFGKMNKECKEDVKKDNIAENKFLQHLVKKYDVKTLDTTFLFNYIEKVKTKYDKPPPTQLQMRADGIASVFTESSNI